MNGTDSRELINYFKNKEGKYLKLNNGEKVELFTVADYQYSLTLTFTYGGKILDIPFTGLYENYITMHIPERLEEGYYASPIVKFDNLRSIGYAIENVLTNWTERKDEVLELNWEDWLDGTSNLYYFIHKV